MRPPNFPGFHKMGLLYTSYSRPLECDNVMGLSFSNADLSLRQLLGAKCRAKPQDHRHFKLQGGKLHGQTSDSLNLPRTNDYPCSLVAHSWLVVSTLMEQRRNNKLKPPTRKYHGQSWTPLLNRKLAGSFNT